MPVDPGAARRSLSLDELDRLHADPELPRADRGASLALCPTPTDHATGERLYDGSACDGCPSCEREDGTAPEVDS